MSKLLSEVLFNRALIWLVMASLENDNKWLRSAYIALAILNMAESLLKAYMNEDV